MNSLNFKIKKVNKEQKHIQNEMTYTTALDFSS